MKDVLDHLARATADAVRRLGRRGAVVAVSGGVDSGVVAGLCTRGADRLGYAVVGTANLLEHDQGFFVKGGDGLT